MSVLDPNVVPGATLTGRPAGRPRRQRRATPPARTSTSSSSRRPPGRSRRPGSSPSPARRSPGRTPGRSTGRPGARVRGGADAGIPRQAARLPGDPAARLRHPAVVYFSHAGGLGSVADLPTRGGMAARLRAHLPRVALFVLAGTRRDGDADLRRRAKAQLDAARTATDGRADAAARRPGRARTRRSSSRRGRSRTPASPGACSARCTATPRTPSPRSRRPPGHACSTPARRSSR